MALVGVLKWGGLEYNVLGIPASLHDFIQLGLLALLVKLRHELDEYFTLVLVFIAFFLFLPAGVMQVVDMRPPGASGELGLAFDNIVNGTCIAVFMLMLAFLRTNELIKRNSKYILLGAFLCLFLAINVIFSFLPFFVSEQTFFNLIYFYDVALYTLIYLVALSASPRIHDFYSICCDRFMLLCRRGIFLRKN